MEKLFILLVVLNLLDVYLTKYVLSHGGRELNPILNRLFSKVDPVAVMLGIKTVYLSLVFLYLEMIPQGLMILLCALYAGLVLWNVLQVWKISRT